MPTVASLRRSVVAKCSGPMLVAILLLAALPAGRLQAQEDARGFGETAKVWAMRVLGLANMQCSYRDRAADYVPSEAPAGLPSNYLAADPRHGRLVDFTDERDSRGTRVTSRTYANGHVVIETPRADTSAGQISESSRPRLPGPTDRS